MSPPSDPPSGPPAGAPRESEPSGWDYFIPAPPQRTGQPAPDPPQRADQPAPDLPQRAERPGSPPPGPPSEPSHPLDSPSALIQPSSAELRLGGHLHPAALAIWPLERALPLVVLLFAGALTGVFVGAVVVITVAATALRYARFQWRVEDGSLVIEQGLLQRQRRVIPFDRVQSVELVRKLRHRAFGVVEVRVEAVGGSSTEGRLEALSPQEAHRLRAVLLRERTVDDLSSTADAWGPDHAAPVLVQVPPHRLLIAGLTGGRVGIAALVVGVTEQVFGQRLFSTLEGLPMTLGFRGILVAGIALAVAVFVLSVVATVVAHWDFKLVREDQSLRVRRGLLQQRSDTIPLRRIQAVRLEENLVRRPFGLAAVRLDVAGRAGGDQGGGTNVALPLGTRDEAEALVERILGKRIAGAPLQPMPHRARTRRLVRAAVALAVLSSGVGLWAGWPAVIAAVAILSAPAIAAALDAYAALGHAEVDGLLIARAGVLVRRTTFVPVERVQTLALARSPFQQRARLATLQLQIARSLGGSDPELVDLDGDLGHRMLKSLADRIAPPRARTQPQPQTAAAASESAEDTAPERRAGDRAGPPDDRAQQPAGPSAPPASPPRPGDPSAPRGGPPRPGDRSVRPRDH